MKISIITINRNTGQSVLRTIDSIRGQTWPDFEWVIVDGASHDNSGDTLHGACRINDSYESGPDRCIADAFNKGIARSKGDAILFMNAGDAFDGSDCLTRLVNNWDISRYRWITGGARVMTEEGEERFIRRHTVSHPIELVSHGCRIFHAATLIDRRLFQGFGGYNERFRISMDYEMWLRWISKGIEPQIEDSIVACFYVGGASSRIMARYEEDRRARQINGMGLSGLGEMRLRGKALTKALCPDSLRNGLAYRIKEGMRW